MKLIIEIPKWYYEETKEFKHPTLIDKAILNGTPLDDVKAEILKRVDEHCARTLEIFDNIGKAESEEI